MRTDTDTRFVRLRPLTQAVALTGTAVMVAWTIVATAILFMDSIGSGSAREQAKREQLMYEQRLDALSGERDQRAEEALAAQERFAVALEQVSQMQSALLASEERRRELETGIGVIQSTLRTAMTERDSARSDAETLRSEMTADARAAGDEGPSAEDVAATLGYVTAALGATAADRDRMSRLADSAEVDADRAALDLRLVEQRHDEIFNQLEQAVTVSLEPLDKMFKSAGLNPDDILGQIRRGYSGQGGPLMPMLPSVQSDGSPDDSAERAGRILEQLDRMNLYRLAVEKTPFALPLNTSFRFTSPFGRRWGRMHEGVDLAGSYGSPIYATADGVVVHAGWSSGYGNLVKIRHQFGIETRYGHMSKIRVHVGQKISRGERIGDMGSTGRSTGTHLHYEVRVNGSAINPMTYIKAAKDVF
ncbi:MAG: peptidoglycan DD-metalloendopeptidase family protein [Defluviimonas sp.]|nr:peptidoglycan DD-metalloendopeptidase family protein [Paracoccaceae bacterium]MCC0064232.1 peptidoglycan DD-metalloendopeptidase family protein [Defluviimonas sp.]